MTRLRKFERELDKVENEMEARNDQLPRQTVQATDNSTPADITPQAEISRVAVRLPSFWTDQPAVWFAQAEAQFALAGISSERTKFYYVVSQLEQHCAAELVDVITCPPEKEPYTTLKAELIRHLSPSKEQRISRLLSHEEMGDRKPSQFLTSLRSLAPEVLDSLLYSIWSSRLPHNIRAILAGQPECDLDSAARRADRISEAAPQPSLAIVTTTLPTGGSTQQPAPLPPHQREEPAFTVPARSSQLQRRLP